MDLGVKRLSRYIGGRHHGFDNALDRACSRQNVEHDRLADANPLGVARIDEELGVEVGWIGNSEQRAVAGGVADIHILLDDRAADRRGDRIDLKRMARLDAGQDLRSEEHTSELQSLMRISYAVFCLKKKIDIIQINIEP